MLDHRYKVTLQGTDDNQKDWSLVSEDLPYQKR